MKLNSRFLSYAVGVLVTGMVIGAVIALFSPGEFLSGFWRGTIFSLVMVMVTVAATRYVQADRTIVVIATIAFLVRIAVGIGLYTVLPEIGFDTEVQNAGYSYSDAFVRDQGSYGTAFPTTLEGKISEVYTADQYGGLSLISVMVYRLFSADVHRPLLMVLFSAFSFAIAILFLWKAISVEWGDKVALAASLVMAAYPEGIILGSSQMREPILIALATISFLAVVLFKQGSRKINIYLLFGVSTLLACWVSIPAGLVILLIEVGFLMLNWISVENDNNRKRFKFAFFSLLLVASVFAGWGWLKNTLYYDAYLTESESGMVSALIEKIGSNWRIPFVMLYGLIQPVLPAALVYQSLPIWKTIAIFRAAGWYFAIPFLIYGAGIVRKDVRKDRDWGLVWLTLTTLVWVAVSSARAGGDQWDNPRYRAIFLPWLALIIAWVWQYLHNNKTVWFWRIVFLEGMFVLLFTNWYLNRVIGVGIPIPINWLLLIYSALAFVVITVGLIWDRSIKNRKINKTPIL